MYPEDTPAGGRRSCHPTGRPPAVSPGKPRGGGASAAAPCWAARAVIITIDVINGPRYARRVIRSFRDAETRKVFERERARKLPPDVQRRAHRKLLLLNATERLEELRVPPGNRLERLAGNRTGQHSIRINDQWRICFRWRDGDAHDVEICDYH